MKKREGTELFKGPSAVLRLALAGMIAALYVLLTLPMANFSFGIIQFRLAEVLTILPALSIAAVPGVFLGCLISNILNPQNLGLIDILGGSGATLVAALLSYWLGGMIRGRLLRPQEEESAEESTFTKWKHWLQRVLVLAPPVLVNALTVGVYLPYLILEHKPSTLEVAGSIAMIFISQAFVVYAIGLPALYALERAGLPLEKI